MPPYFNAWLLYISSPFPISPGATVSIRTAYALPINHAGCILPGTTAEVLWSVSPFILLVTRSMHAES